MQASEQLSGHAGKKDEQTDENSDDGYRQNKRGQIEKMFIR